MTWKLTKLSEIASVHSGGGAPQDDQAFSTEGFPFVRAGSLVKLLSGLPEDQLELIKPDVASVYKLKLFPRGAVLFAKSGMSATKGHIYQLQKPAYVVNHLAALVPYNELDTDFLRHVLAFKSPTTLIKDESYPSIRLGDIEEMQVPSPQAQGERQRIAAILDQAYDLRRKRQRAIDRLKTLGQAVFYEMFGEVGSANVRWQQQPLERLCELVRGSSPRPQGDSRFFGGSVPRLMIADITRDGMSVTPQIDSLTEEGAKKSRPMPAGSVVMAVSGAVGLPAILAVDACIHDGFVGFRNLGKNILPQFLYWFLFVNRAENRSQGTGAIWVNLTTDQVKRFLIPVPPMALQLQLVERMERLFKQVEVQKGGSVLFKGLFSALQNRAFRGEL